MFCCVEIVMLFCLFCDAKMREPNWDGIIFELHISIQYRLCLEMLSDNLGYCMKVIRLADLAVCSILASGSSWLLC